MSPFLIQFLLCLALLTAFDAMWFTGIMNRFFIEHLSHLLNIEQGHIILRWFPAMMVYVLLALGIVLFVLPSSAQLSLGSVFFHGGIFGVVVYGVYEGTNGALMKDWPTRLIIADMVWGFLACGATSLVVQSLTR